MYWLCNVCTNVCSVTLAEQTFHVSCFDFAALSWWPELFELTCSHAALTLQTSCLPPSPLAGLKSRLTPPPTVPQLDPSSPLPPSSPPPPSVPTTCTAPLHPELNPPPPPVSCTFPTVCPKLTRKHSHTHRHTHTHTHTHAHTCTHTVGAAGSL